MEIKYFLDHINENLNIKEMPIIFSDKFRDMIESMNSRVSNELLKLEKSNLKLDFSYIDFSENENMFSVLYVNRMARVDNIQENDLIDPSEDSVVWSTRYRQDMRIGAFINKLLLNSITAVELENFVNSIKGKLALNQYKISLVVGEDIRKWYHVKHYFNPTPDIVDRDDLEENQADPRTPLMKSCLKQPEKQPFFNIFTKNPEQIAMLIMLNKNNELIARALIWLDCFFVDNQKNPTRGILMDRIYYTNESDVNIFIDYAKKNNWWYKSAQAKEIFTFVVNDVVVEKVLTTRLKNHGDFDPYPYLDTLCYYTPASGRLSTNRGVPVKHPNTGEVLERYLLHSTGGGKKRLSRDK